MELSGNVPGLSASAKTLLDDDRRGLAETPAALDGRTRRTLVPTREAEGAPSLGNLKIMARSEDLARRG